MFIKGLSERVRSFMKLVRANAQISEELSTAGRQQATKQLEQNLYARLADSLL